MTDPSVTTWVRLEPHCSSSSADIQRALYLAQLEARVFDPLWLLCRQWQLGEFQGEDAATPVSARIDHTLAPITRYRMGDDPATHDFAGTIEVWADAPARRLPPPAPVTFSYTWGDDTAFAVAPGDMLFVDLRLAGDAAPAAVWVTWVDSESGQEHSARWGVADRAFQGVYAGELSSAARQRLQVPASAVDLEGRHVARMHAGFVSDPPAPRLAMPGAAGRMLATPAPAPPLEALVERHAPDELEVQQAAESGLHFLRLLTRNLTGESAERAAAYRAAYATDPDLAFTLPPLAPSDMPRLDDATRGLVSVMAGRVPSGTRLAGLLRSEAPGLLARLGIADADTDAVEAAHAEWLAWHDGLVSNAAPDESSAAHPTRLEHRFEVRTPETGFDAIARLIAPEYTGDLDWYTFDIAKSDATSILAAVPIPTPGTSRRAHRVLTELQYSGMPQRRFWQFEDARVDLGSLVVAPGDTASLLVALFAFAYSNDWYRLPLSVDVGTLCRINSLDVTTTIGPEKIALQPYSATGADGGTTLFQLSTTEGRSTPGLLLPPSLPTMRLRGEPIEEVHFTRDEVANLGFAIEKTIPNLLGRPRHRDEDRAPHEPPAIPAPGADVTYRLRQDPAPNWIPLMPEPPPGTMLRVNGEPSGLVLRAQPALQEEELRFDGVTVRLRYELARAANGATVLWRTREVHPGSPTASSGLQFDRIIDRSEDDAT